MESMVSEIRLEQEQERELVCQMASRIAAGILAGRYPTGPGVEPVSSLSVRLAKAIIEEVEFPRRRDE